MILRALEAEDMPYIITWRNQVLPTLRTSFPLTMKQQMDWYEKEVCNRDSRTRFFAIDEVCHDAIESYYKLVGYGGIEHIEWENSCGEISLLINPTEQHKGLGKKAANMIIDFAFNNLNLHTVWGEVYNSNQARSFWEKLTKERSGVITQLPKRKYSGGQYHDSTFFAVFKG